MTVFIVAALLLGALTLAYVFGPLLQQRVGTGALLVVLGLGATAGLYALVGTPDALDPARRETPRTLEAAIERLEQELRRDPKQVEGWRLLAEAYRAKARTQDAAQALARAVELQPKDPELLAQAAEARALATQDRRFDAQAITLLRRALAMDPTHQRAAWFLGVAQRQAGQPAEAARTWESLLAHVDAATATALRAQIRTARDDAGLPPLPEAPTGTPPAGRIRVRVDIDPALRDRLPPTAPVFVIARAAGGPPMPVAVERLSRADLPAEVELDDGDSPMPTARLSQVERVEVIARVSASGGANAGTGDLESAPMATTPGTSVRVRIDRARP
jgi:cytochrome c-type biogenesis protein CcmH